MAQNSALPAFWNQRYQQGVTPWEGASPDAEMQRFIATLPVGSRVLLPGCGSASDARWLAEAGMRVDAIDFSEEAIERASQALQGTPVRVRQADFFALSASPVYDLVFERAFLCALPPSRWDDYTHKMSQLIGKDGYLAGVFFLADKPKGPPFGTSLEALQQRFAGHFVLRQCKGVAEAIPVFADQEFWMVWQRVSAGDEGRQ